MKIKFLILSVAACFVMASCGKTVENTPKDVTLAFVEAMASKDFDGAKGYCTKTSGAVIDGMKSFASMAPETKLSKSEVTCEESGDKATCKFCCAEGKSEETYNLVKEDGKWKVEYVKSGMDNATEGLNDATEKLEEAVDTLKQALDTLSVN
jgi:Domain of unknown function (DUF4878)